MFHATLHTTKGPIRLVLEAEKTPNTVANFVTLAKNGFYDNLNFHRVIEDFMIQAWCPIGNGTWWPGYAFGDEFHPELTHEWAGILSMANSGPDSNGSQFFITHGPTPRLDGKHTVFGVVYDENDQAIVDIIEQWDMITTIEIHDNLILPEETAEFVHQIEQMLEEI